MICPRCKRNVNLMDSYGESQLYKSYHRLCMGCWHAEADEIDSRGSNNLPDTLASYGPPNDFEDGPDDFDRELQRALEADGEKLRQLTGEDHGPWSVDDLYPGQAPCHACFESSGYVWEHGNDWNSGPWSHQTNIQCNYCNGTGSVDAPLVTLDDLEELAMDEAEGKAK